MITNEVNVSLNEEENEVKTVPSQVQTDENGNDPLMVAIINNDEELVNKLIKENKDIDLSFKNKDGNTALHLAIYGENENILKTILQYPLKFNSRNNNNDTALTMAMNCKNEHILNILLDKNPKFSFKKKKDGKFPLVMAVDDKKFSTAMQLIRHGATTLVKDSEGSYILFKLLAAESEFKNIIEIEIKNKEAFQEKVTTIADNNGNTLLMRACKENRKIVAKYMLSRKPSLAIKNNDGDTALVLAVKEKNIEIVKLLLDYQDVDTAKITTGNQKSIFQVAIENQDKDSLELLFKHTKDYTLFTNITAEKNLFIEALNIGNPDVVGVILDYVDINIFVNDKKETPLLYLVEKIKNEILEAEDYYKSLYLRNKKRNEMNALAALAASKESTPVVSDHEVIEIEKEPLMKEPESSKSNNETSSMTDESENTLKEPTSDEGNESGANSELMEEPQEEKIEEKPEVGKMAPEVIRKKVTVRRTYSSYERMVESERKIQDILNSNGTIDEKFNSIENAYNTNRRLLNGDRYWKAKDKTYVVESNYINIIQILLINHAKINKRNVKLESALHIACRYGLRNIIELILKHGKNFDINHVDKEGNTPLHYACYGKYTSIVKILLREEQINVNISDQNGDTPLMIAVYNNHSDTVLELLKFQKTNIDILNKVLETPLIAACRLNYYNVAKALIDHKANINNRYDANGETAIFHSVRNGSKILTKYLLNNKACITYTNKNGQTPLVLAKSLNNKEVISILLKHIDSDKTLTRRNTERPYISRNSSRYSSGKPSPDLKPFHARNKSEIINIKSKTTYGHPFKSENSSPKVSSAISKSLGMTMTMMEPEEDVSSTTPSKSSSILMMEPSSIYDKPEDVGKSIQGSVFEEPKSSLMMEPSSIYDEPKDSIGIQSTSSSMYAEPMEEPAELYEEPPSEEKKEIKPASSAFNNIKFRPSINFNESVNAMHSKNKKPFKSTGPSTSPYLKSVFASPKSNSTYVKKTVYSSARFPATYTRVNSENAKLDKMSKPYYSSSTTYDKSTSSEIENKEIPILNDDIKGLRFSCYFGDIEGVENFLRSSLKENNIFQLPESLHAPGNVEPPNTEALKAYNKTRPGYITLDHIEMFAFSLICNGSKNDSLLEIMLRYGMNPNIQNNALYTLLILACKKGQETSALTLLDYNCDPNCQNKYKETALLLACKKGLYNVVNKLIERNVDVNMCNYKKESPLIMACWKKQVPIVKLLLQQKVDINHCNSLKESSLFIACYQNSTEIAEILLENGAEVNTKNVNDETPLFAACTNNNEELVNLLMKHNADVNIKNKKGETPMTIADRYKNKKIRNLLRKTN